MLISMLDLWYGTALMAPVGPSSLLSSLGHEAPDEMIPATKACLLTIADDCTRQAGKVVDENGIRHTV